MHFIRATEFTWNIKKFILHNSLPWVFNSIRKKSQHLTKSQFVFPDDISTQMNGDDLNQRISSDFWLRYWTKFRMCSVLQISCSNVSWNAIRKFNDNSLISIVGWLFWVREFIVVYLCLPYVAAGLEQLLASGTREPGGIIDSSHGDWASLCRCLL